MEETRKQDIIMGWWWIVKACRLSWHELQQHFSKAILVSVKESIVHMHAGTVFDMN